MEVRRDDGSHSVKSRRERSVWRQQQASDLAEKEVCFWLSLLFSVCVRVCVYSYVCYVCFIVYVCVVACVHMCLCVSVYVVFCVLHV